MKIQIQYVKRNDCYISLPQIIKDQIQKKQENQICQVIKLKQLSSSITFYFGFTGLISSNNNFVEISDVFAQANGIQDQEFFELSNYNDQAEVATQLTFKCRNSDDYEIVSIKRSSIEEQMLNQISVVFNQMQFPIYYNQQQYVILKYEQLKVNDKCFILDQDAEIEIVMDFEKNVKSISQQNFYAKQKVGGYIFEDSFCHINKDLFKKLQLKELHPYSLQKILLLNNSKRNFQKYLQKIEKLGKNGKKPKKQKIIYFQCIENMNDLQVIKMGKYLMKILNISENQQIILDLKFEIKDFNYNRTFNDLDGFLNSKIKLIFFPMQQDMNVDLNEISQQILDNYLTNKPTLIYSDKMIKFQNQIFITKIIESDQNVLDFVMIKNDQNKNKSNIIQFDQIMSKLHLRKQQDIIKIFPMKLIQKYSKMIQKQNYSQYKITDDQNCVDLKTQSQFYEQQCQEIILHFKQKDNKVIYLEGPQRIGKSFLAKKLSQIILQQYPVLFLDLIIFTRQTSLNIVKSYLNSNILTKTFEIPSDKILIVIDNLQNLCQNDSEHPQDQIYSQCFSKFLKKLIFQIPQACFVLICEKQEKLDKQLQSLSDLKVEMKYPTYDQRVEYFEKLYDDLSKSQIEDLAQQTESFNISNLELIKQRVQRQRDELAISCSENKKQFIQRVIQDLQNKTFKSSKKHPLFKHIGGLYEAKQIIRDTYEVPQKFKFIFEQIKTKLSSGILLYGPPGCGKTYLAVATANELQMNFISVKGPELLNKYIGASEQAVRDIFEKAGSQAPCIVFLDEFDAIVPRRNSGSTNVTDRVVNQFLCYLDGVAALKGVYVLAASSRPDLIDPALLRPGRIDQHIYVGFPDTEEREKILDIYIHQANLTGIGSQQIAELTQQFTSADLVSLLKEITIKKAHSFIEGVLDHDFKQEDKKQIKLEINRQDFDIVYKTFRKSLNLNEIQKLEKLFSDFSQKKIDITKQKQTMY